MVASVFAFAVLTTGLLSSEKSKESVLGALEEAGSTLRLSGSVVAVATTSLAHVANIRFQVASASKTGGGVNFADDQIVVTYIDEFQAFNITTADRTITFLSGSSPVLDPDERVDIDIDIDDILTTKLSTSTEFTIELKPSVGGRLDREQEDASRAYAGRCSSTKGRPARIVTGRSNGLSTGRGIKRNLFPHRVMSPQGRIWGRCRNRG